MSPVYYLRKAGEFSTHMAIGSFAIGTLILLLYKTIPDNFDMLLIGLAYIVIAFVLNSIVFFHLLYYFITQKKLPRIFRRQNADFAY